MDTGTPAYRRTRIAPTPSGYLHLGNAFSFSATVFLARRAGAKVFLRIDDLDRERVKQAYVGDVFDTLDFLEIPWDEGPRNYREYETVYSQVHRMPLYEDALQRLRNTGAVFACDCSRSDVLGRHPQGVYTGVCRQRGLPLDAGGCNWRVDTSAGEGVGFANWGGERVRSVLPEIMRHFVVRKRDGFPAYQLASVVDDAHFGVDLVVRGVDLWDSTLAQCLLADVLGLRSFREATFFHHALLTTETDEKLSKSAGATSIQYFRKQGKTKADVYRLIGDMLGLPGAIPDWEGLGAALVNAGRLYPQGR